MPPFFNEMVPLSYIKLLYSNNPKLLFGIIKKIPKQSFQTPIWHYKETSNVWHYKENSNTIININTYIHRSKGGSSEASPGSPPVKWLKQQQMATSETAKEVYVLGSWNTKESAADC
jgi:hypothetical protein